METSSLPVDEDGRFIINSSKIKQHALVSPSIRDAKLGRQPGEVGVFTLDAYIKLLTMFIEWNSNTDTPDKPLSRHDGIRTSSVRLSAGGGVANSSLLSARRYFQIPFKFRHGVRCSWGRGYSGHGFVPTLYVQSVSKGGVFTS